ncbi:MAG: hypothetical protein ACK4PK_06620 [Alphaproteobacteria bacterium]
MSADPSKSTMRKLYFASLGAVFIAAAGSDGAEARGFGGGGGGGYSAPRMSTPPAAARPVAPAPAPNALTNPTHPLSPLNPLNPLSPVSPLNPMYHQHTYADTATVPEATAPAAKPAAKAPRDADNSTSTLGAVFVFGSMLAAVFALSRATSRTPAPPLPPKPSTPQPARPFSSGYQRDF